MPLRQQPVADGLFTWPSSEPRLIGGRCDGCGLVSFPRASGCSRCGSGSIATHALGRRGTLWTWTVQAFPPKAPYEGPSGDEFVPYGVGYVELDGEIRVEGRLTESSGLEIGMPMEVTLVPFRRDGEVKVVTYAFQPVAA